MTKTASICLYDDCQLNWKALWKQSSRVREPTRNCNPRGQKFNNRWCATMRCGASSRQWAVCSSLITWAAAVASRQPTNEVCPHPATCLRLQVDNCISFDEQFDRCSDTALHGSCMRQLHDCVISWWRTVYCHSHLTVQEVHRGWSAWGRVSIGQRSVP